uniref:Zf-C6H2 domain-containing protein n=1 Tax=Globodera pallida TaxID=36090 RepID=A0A183CNP9_GLOPA
MIRNKTKMTPGAGEKLDEVLSALRQCESKDCDKSVEGNLRCPTCVKLGRPDAFFCSQKCFKGNFGVWG